MALPLALVVAACGVSDTSYPSGPGPTATTSESVATASAVPSATPTLSASPDAISSLGPTGPVSERVTAFYYPWYRSAPFDGSWVHWNQLKHTPPDNIASSFYPVRGPYSSADPAVMAAEMRELAAARVGVISVSWWGQGSIEDRILPELFTGAAAAGIGISFHMEPYQGQTAASMVADIHYLLARYGTAPALYRASRATASDASTAPRPVFYVFTSSRFPAADLKAAIATLRGTADDAIVLVHSPKAISATRVGADGVYTYDATADPAAMAKLVADCKTAGLICSPSVAPGFDNRQAVDTGIQVVDRANGGRYDSMWQSAIAAGAEWVSVTSFNEWHEGTQIEPARAFSAGGRTYVDYDGAYGLAGTAAQTAYLTRTATWVGKLEGS